MSNTEIISANNAERIDTIGAELAESYKVAFAGPPWFEISKCINEECRVGLTAYEVGCECLSCKTILSEAYDTNELTSLWRRQIENEEAILEVAYNESYPQRATLARPTNTEELFTRKYLDVPAMKNVIDRILPTEFVWIEDTFANRERVPTGNLRDRGLTIDRIANFYGGNVTIATRTLANGIVASTLRDKLANTQAYIGSEGAGREIVNRAFSNPGYDLPTVPDRRTLLVIKAVKGL